MDEDRLKKENGATDPFWDLSFARPKKVDRELSTFSSDTDAPLISVADSGIKDKIDERRYVIKDKVLGRGADDGRSEEERYRIDIGASASRERTEEDEEFTSYFNSLREKARRASHTDGRFTDDLIRRSDSRYKVSVPHSTAQHPSGIIRSYAPVHPLITKVEVLEWPSKYTFYDKFRRDAVKYFEQAGRECGYEDFTSFVPQYSMMTEAQRRYYLWWRTCVREGRYIKASKSYLLLLIYEIINLSDILPPTEGVRIICELIKNYRQNIWGIRKSVSAWLRDYCLIHRLSVPGEYMDTVFAYAAGSDMLPEFFVKYDEQSMDVDPYSLVELISCYSWKDSKYITDENRSIYERHMKGAILAACRTYGDGLPFGADKLPEGKYISESYSGAICTSSIKCRLRITYHKCARADEYSYATWTVKYAENQVRRLLGIKARFKLGDLPERITVAIDLYFAPMLEQMAMQRQREKEQLRDDQTMPSDYERFYEAEREEISFDRAIEIERSSWAVTRRLVEAFEDGAQSSGAESGSISTQEGDGHSVTFKSSEELSSEESCAAVPILSEKSSACGVLQRAAGLLLEGNISSFAALAEEQRILPDTLAERINDAMYDLIGDIAIDQSDPSYPIIEDYRSDVENFVRGG